MERRILGAGAEAILYLDKDVVKDRISKKYRIAEIDTRLRQFRTRREAKVLEKLQRIGIPAPQLIENDRKQRLVMDYITGEKLRDVLEKSDYRKLCEELGKKIALMHNNGVIHGDLTTSNMILKDEIYFIDFGLSFFSSKIEDRAVDLHLLRQALESKHHTIWRICFEHAIRGYREEAVDAKEVLKRLEKVESRGRYKGKG